MTDITKDNDTYSFCVGHNCKYHNNVLVKRVYKHLLYIPLCTQCIKNYERKINMLFNQSEYINKYEIAEIYFKNIGLI